ncbi:RHS repeat-associated core domain-containing protein [Pseudomonas coleopterorum]|uniref:RHS repeat-associated core domain-containing protein n=1 Tax=Pseudomonas coleopterorum TaxID=1605838 RepID=UPI0017814584|nr:RHS repeat-associated core domain-containing protein [Pseudomonas coleopterorum]MBD8481359.1 RHS repeat protein [Pseudomonas coleopterorum]
MTNLHTTAYLAALLIVNCSSAYATSHTWKYEYNLQRLISSMEGPRDDIVNKSVFDYDEYGNLKGFSNAMGHTTKFSQFDMFGNPQHIVGPNGETTSIEYAFSGEIAFIKSNDLKVNGFYTLAGDLEAVDVNGRRLFTLEWTHDRQLSDIKDDVGNKITYGYDAAGNFTTEVVQDASGSKRYVSEVTYDAFGDPSTFSEGDDMPYRFQHDGNHNLTEIVSPNGGTTRGQYNALDQLIKRTDASGAETTFGYNKQGGLTLVNGPRGSVTEYTYDSLRNLIGVQSNDKGNIILTRDKAGNIIRRQDARGYVVKSTFDALNRITARQYSVHPELDTTYSYDGISNENHGVGHLTSATTAATKLDYHYNINGRVSKTAQWIQTPKGDFTNDLSYGYTSTGEVASIDHNGSVQFNYTHTPSGQITSVKATIGNHPPITLADSINFLPQGPIHSLTWGNGIQVSNIFDSSYRLKEQSMNGAVRTYTYDNNGNITQIARGSGHVIRYTYDTLDRLIEEDDATLEHTYTLDATGNLLNYKQNSTMDLWSRTYNYRYFNHSNRLKNSKRNRVHHDASGNIIYLNGKQFSYDEENRVVMVKLLGKESARYLYNGMNQRALKTTAQGHTSFVYGLDDEIQFETSYNDSGLKISSKHYAWIDHRLIGGIAIQYASNGNVVSHSLFYVHSDHLGTPRMVTDSNGETIWAWESNAYGIGKPNGAFELNHRFIGQYYDTETGLHFSRNRIYDPFLGRFLSTDPDVPPADTNTYVYARNNPLTFYDVDGRASSGVPRKIPGTQITVRIDPSHIPGQTHAHVMQKGKPEIVIKQDGSGSHGSDPGKLPKHKKLLEFLRKKGFKVSTLFFLPDYSEVMENYCVLNPHDGQCLTQDTDC